MTSVPAVRCLHVRLGNLQCEHQRDQYNNYIVLCITNCDRKKRLSFEGLVGKSWLLSKSHANWGFRVVSQCIVWFPAIISLTLVDFCGPVNKVLLSCHSAVTNSVFKKIKEAKHFKYLSTVSSQRMIYRCSCNERLHSFITTEQTQLSALCQSRLIGVESSGTRQHFEPRLFCQVMILWHHN